MIRGGSAVMGSRKGRCVQFIVRSSNISLLVMISMRFWIKPEQREVPFGVGHVEYRHA
jgi:hypothetical protein